MTGCRRPAFDTSVGWSSLVDAPLVCRRAFIQGTMMVPGYCRAAAARLGCSMVTAQAGNPRTSALGPVLLNKSTIT